MILIVDNYDSFTYNLAQAFEILGRRVRVVRNDAIDLAGIRRLAPEALVLSPGPGSPESAGVTVACAREPWPFPVLGVCLGHQAIGQAFGGRVVRAPAPVHGKPCVVRHRGEGLFAQLSRPLTVGRYHSLVVDRSSLPRCLAVTAWSDDGLVMGLRHRERAVFGVQFHPESILTPEGPALLRNFLRASAGSARDSPSASRSSGRRRR